VGTKAFLDKEWRESWRSGRLFLLSALFLILGISTPLMLKFLPQLLPVEWQSVLGSLLPSGPVAAVDSLFKNLAQVGLLVLVLVVMGTIAEERARGQLELVLSKPVSVAGIVWAKFVVHAFAFLLAVLCAFLPFFAYLRVLSPPGVALLPLLAGAGFFAGYGLLVIAFTLFASALFASQVGAALLSGGFFLALSFLPNLGGDFARLSPAGLLATARGLAIGAGGPGVELLGLGVTVGSIALFLCLAVVAVRNHEW
jgi:ABC-2 type transport system permease protein